MLIMLIASLISHAGEQLNWVIDLIGDQLILCQRRLLTRKLVCDTSFTLRSRPPEINREVFALGTLPTPLIPQICHVKVEAFLQPERAPPHPSPLQVGEKSSLNRV
jgi:hypothetical protein